MNCLKAFIVLIALWTTSVSSVVACPLHSSNGNGNNSTSEQEEQEAAKPAQV